MTTGITGVDGATILNPSTAVVTVMAGVITPSATSIAAPTAATI